MFEDATFDSRGNVSTRTPQWMIAAFAVNASIFAALVALPILYPGSLPSRLLRQALLMPVPPSAPTPPHLNQPLPQPTQTVTNPYLAPIGIPSTINRDPGPAPAFDPSSMEAANDGIQGAPAPTSVFTQNQPRVVVAPPAQPHKPVPISLGVAEGLLIYHPSPQYPIIAKTTGTSGTIVLAAMISISGKIENLRVLSGPPLLRQAAIDAVQQWKYRPYLLNNQPVEVETTINIVFLLGSR